VQERYCTHCGQENIEPRETLGHLIRHFFEDITHFDSKFFSFFKYLVIRPGFLTRQYIAGHRASYLNPIRAYIFISFVFFLVLFAGKKKEAAEAPGEALLAPVKQQIAGDLRKAQKTDGQTGVYDSIRNEVLQEVATSLEKSAHTEPEQSIHFALGTEGVQFQLTDTRYNNLREYDSVQNSLPDTSAQKDKGLMKWIIRNNVRLKHEYGSRSSVVLAENFEHSIPKIMFLVLPLFALYVMLFYKRKNYYYVQHGIFSIHFHSFIFLLFLFRFLLGTFIHGEWSTIILQVLTILTLLIYLTIALKNTYQQSYWLTILKTLGISVLYILTLVIGIFLLVLFTFLMA
jgi:hypothetical protein